MERENLVSQKGLSRRSFLKGAGVAGAAVAATSFAACTPEVEDPDWDLTGMEGSPWVLPTKWDIVTDVIVVGTGDAGGPAAIRAYDEGAEVLVIDKGDFYGGCSAIGGGNVQLACTHVQVAQGISDRKEWAFEDTMEHGLYRSNPEVLQAWIDESGPYAKWAETAAKMEWGQVTSQEPARVPRSHRSQGYRGQANGAGINMVMRYHDAAEARGIPYLLENKMTKVYRKVNGPVVGVEVETPEGIKNYKARRAVILCTGGFKSNPQMIRSYHPLFDEHLIYSGWPDVNNTGDGHLAIMNIGGACVDMSFIMEFSGRLGSVQYVRWDRPHFDNPSTSTGIASSRIQNVIFVNNSGNRYLDEDEWEAGHTLPWTPWMVAYLLIEGRPRMEWWVTDNKGAVDIGWKNQEASFDNPDRTKTPCAEPGWVAKANTIAELATKMGVPSAALGATVTRYNGLVAGGKDTDFGRSRLNDITEPPYWAARWCRMSHDQCTGIRVNAKAQIPDTAYLFQPYSGSENHQPVPISQEPVIPHLYAAGECTGGIGGAIRGSGKRGYYQVFGYIAGYWGAHETPLED
ncbi:MAG: FAD-dependent oxidoreductase [Coriobacteriia bacterium]|nr:FAD-dependent oxidoreductase [Coriobacteriia bacterium]